MCENSDKMNNEWMESLPATVRTRADISRQLSALGGDNRVSDSNLFAFSSDSLLFGSQNEDNLETNSISMSSQSFWKSSEQQLQQQSQPLQYQQQNQQQVIRMAESKRKTFTRSISLLSSSSTLNSNSFYNSTSTPLAVRRGKRGLVLQPLGELRRRLITGLSYE